MNALYCHPLLFVGLAIRLGIIAIAEPQPSVDWFAPFLDITTTQFTGDPWSFWLQSGGSPLAFPYGYAMWLVFLPVTLVFKALGLPVVYGYATTLLASDLAMLGVLERLIPGRPKLVLILYWLSPIVIQATYGLGLNDLVPALLMALSLLFMRNNRIGWAGVTLATAISAKLSMILALPFFLIFLFNNKSLRSRIIAFASGFSLSVVLFWLPFSFSRSGITMLFSNPEMAKIYHLTIDLGGHVSIYIIPLIYAVIVYMAWRARRLNDELFHAMLGMSFLLIVLMTPSSPGWLIWCIPFLLFYQIASGGMAVLLSCFFSALYLVSTLLATPVQLRFGLEYDAAELIGLSDQAGRQLVSLLHTAMLATGIVLSIRIWREAINRNDYFRFSRKPFVIGIAGDSGAGKDTFADAVIGLFGSHSTVKLSGDDYHLWDRQKPIWQVMTHLNPMANDLEAFCNDLLALLDGKSIQARHYDHQTGKMSRPQSIQPNDFIVACGLHALYLPFLRTCYDLKIYLDIDEDLRRYFKLKRDVGLRGHSVDRVMTSFNQREPDSERFIRPQSAHADLTLSLQPIHPSMVSLSGVPNVLRLKLVVNTRHGFNERSLVRVLIGICGLHVDMTMTGNGEGVSMTIEGDVTAADIALATRILCPRMMEFLDVEPFWCDGVIGLMQLITLSHVNQALTKRLI